MDAVRITLLSRQGAASLPPGVLRELADRGRLEAHALSGAPRPAQALRLLAGADVLAATNACLPVLDGRTLARLPALRDVVLYATGSDHVDLPALGRAGVRLTLLPDYATVAVAEHTLALLLALATRLHLAHDRSRGTAPAGVSLRGTELAGRTLGVVGLGRIGGHVARLGAGIGMHVVGSDPRTAVPGAGSGGGPLVERTSLEDLLRRSDAVCVCAARTFGAPALLGPRELAVMRPGAWLVNASRAALVDTPAAVAALRSGSLRGYAVDDTVLDPLVDGDLLAEGRVLQTGHSAWWRDEVLERGARMWGRAILDVVDRLAAARAVHLTRAGA
jgi:phosphoglycerate dehydrogenase-like enzyme